MDISLALTLIAVFTSVALMAGSLTSATLERSSPQARRIRDLLRPRAARADASDLTRGSDQPGKVLSKLQTFVPKSPKAMSKLQRRLAMAGMYKNMLYALRDSPFIGAMLRQDRHVFGSYLRRPDTVLRSLQGGMSPRHQAVRMLQEAGATAAEPVTDSNGSADYKHALVRTMIGRAVRQAAERASGGATT